jgi:hypothetical protein
MPKLSKKGWLILAAIAAAIVEGAVGVLISRTLALCLLFIFVPHLLASRLSESRTTKEEAKGLETEGLCCG